MAEVRLGWVGVGRHTRQVLFPALRDLPVRVVAVCDTNGEAAHAFAGRNGVPSVYTDYRDMGQRETLDAVACAANSAVHYQVAAHFAARGIPVFIEKTPCDTPEQAQTLARLERAHDTWIMTGFNRRFATGYVMAKEIIDRPAFGRPLLFASKFHAGPYASARYFLTNHLLHHLDLARLMMGEITDLRLRRVQLDDARVGYHLDAVSENGALVSIESSSFQDLRYPMERMEITGEGSFVCVENMKSLVYQRPPTDMSQFETASMREGTGALCWQPNLGFPFPNAHLGNEDEMRHFIECVGENRAPQLTFADTARTMALLFEVLTLDEMQ